MAIPVDYSIHQIAFNEKNAILYQPLPGKPNPEEMAEEKGESRSRIVQSQQKGPTCWYYALSEIRKRIGKKCPPGLKKARGIEKTISNLRKSLTHPPAPKPSIVNFVGKVDAANIDKATAEKSLKNWRISAIHTFEKYIPMLTKSPTVSAKPLLEIYVKKAKDGEMFHEFVQRWSKNKVIKLYLETFKKLGIDFQKMYKQLTPFPHTSFENLKTKDKLLTTNALMAWAAAEKYGLSFSNWKSDSKIESLIQKLKRYGPHKATGSLGCAYYEDEPISFTHRSQTIFKWKKGATQKKHNANHAIVVMGAEIFRGKEYVYYIDPNNPSDPQDPLKRKIYITSYDSFKKKIRPITNRKDHPFLIHRSSPLEYSHMKNPFA